MLPLIGALIGAGANILGAAVSKPKTKYQVPDYAGIRRAAEAAGFNPLTALQAAPGQAVQSSNFMGQAIADSGLMIADALASRGGSGQVSRLQQANADLQSKVQSLTLRPEVGGVYARRQSVPSLRQALGVQDDRTSNSGNHFAVSAVGDAGGSRPPSGGSAELAPLLDVDPADPRRSVDNKPVPTSPGVMVVDSPWFGRYYFPTIDGEEPLDLFDLPSMAVGIPQIGYHFGQYLPSAGTLTAADRKRRAEYAAKGQRYLSERYPVHPKPRPNFNTNYYTARHGGPLIGFR